ncbi:hypothetical protein OEZ85_011950 [Tetradesmus obliquus]|uniref:ubiquitinyl hydrolase 1 n=1 Tax=Tetradesmus obliquus TaxID=3088 RepID=A0ABY8TRV1_TETOB|nr:hypothetical protein OEZ85_011950 [Tetradesmus obliquus]
MAPEQPTDGSAAAAAPTSGEQQQAGPSTDLDAQIAQGMVDYQNQLLNIDEIRESESNKPYIGDKESLDALKAEYANGSQVFVAKISNLQTQYSSMRRTRGDGNCFFRSFIYGYLEWLLLHQQEQECQRFTKCLQGWKQKLQDIGYDSIVFEDPLDMLLQQVQAILIGPGVEGGIDEQQLLANFHDDTWSNTCVMLLRFITSAEIKRRVDHFEPFVVGQYEMDVATFCERSVDVMGEESDHIHAQALTDAVQVPVRIVQIDSSGGQEASVVDMKPEGLSAEEQAALGPPKVHMLYRPGHYDILYPC